MEVGKYGRGGVWWRTMWWESRAYSYSGEYYGYGSMVVVDCIMVGVDCIVVGVDCILVGVDCIVVGVVNIDVLVGELS